MARVKGGVHAKKSHKAVMERAKGFRGARSRRFRVAKEAVNHADRYAYRDRRARKGDFRRLWIARINAAARQEGLSYSRLMHGLRLAEVELDRKQLADLAVNDAATFGTLVAAAKAALGDEATAPATADTAVDEPTEADDAPAASDEVADDTEVADEADDEVADEADDEPEASAAADEADDADDAPEASDDTPDESDAA